MKKLYIIPDLKAIRLCSAMHLMEGSKTIDIDDDDVDLSDKSNSYQGGLLWEDDAQ